MQRILLNVLDVRQKLLEYGAVRSILKVAVTIVKGDNMISNILKILFRKLMYRKKCKIKSNEFSCFQ